jgi:hypothetical protein
MKDIIGTGQLLAFAPLHKRAFATAVGCATALAMMLLSLASMMLDPDDQLNLALLSEYLAGYTVSPAGALIGAAWGFFIGFVSGWFFAFSRNLAMATWVFLVWTRAELNQTRDFLDHI